MESVHFSHPFDLDTETHELDLFAEEIGDSQRHDLPPNSFSTLACECDISTFFCYGCGAAAELSQEATLQGAQGLQNVDPVGNFKVPLDWARGSMSASAKTDKVAEVVQMLFRKG
jgi:hypothetical protein